VVSGTRECRLALAAYHRDGWVSDPPEVAAVVVVA